MDGDLADEATVNAKRVGANRAMVRSIATGVSLQITALFSGILAARVLGPTDRGHLALFWIVSLIVVQLGTLGLPVALTYHAAKGPGRTRALVSRVLPSAIMQALVIFVMQAAILVVVFRHATGGTQTAAFITLFTGPALVAQVYGVATLQGMRAYRHYNTQRFMSALLYALGLAALVILSDPGLLAVSAVYTAAAVCTAAVTVVKVLRLMRPELSVPGDDVPTRRTLARFGMRSLLGTFGATEHLQLDQALVGLLLPARDLGLYVAAVAFTQLPRFMGWSIAAVAYPEIAHMTRPRQGMWRISAMSAAAAVTIVGAELLTVEWLLPLAFGPDFRPAIDAARILLIGAMFQMARRVLAEAARGAGMPLAGTVSEVSLYVLIGAALLATSRSLNGIAFAFALASGGSFAVLVAAVSAGSIRQRGAEVHERERT